MGLSLVQDYDIGFVVALVTRWADEWASLETALSSESYSYHTIPPQELFVRLDELRPDILIYDTKDSDPPVLETCSLIQQNHQWADIEVIMLCQSIEQEKLYQSGASYCLCRDNFNPKTLQRIVENTLILRLYEEEVSRVHEEQERQVETLQTERHSYAVFVGTLSHEVRTPLGIIEGFATNLIDGLDGELNENQQQSLQIIHKNIHRLKQYLGDILDHSKLEVGKDEDAVKTKGAPPIRRVNRRRFLSLREVLDEVVELFGNNFKQKGLDLTKDWGPGDHRLWMDPTKMRQVFVNIVSNAGKFTPKGGSVSLELVTLNDKKEPVSTEALGGRRSAYLQAIVTDTGKGIPEEDIPALFGQFIRSGQEEDPLEDGTGLGLAICKEIIDDHGGTIHIESEVGKGTSVKITLPIDLRRRQGKIFLVENPEWIEEILLHYKEDIKTFTHLITKNDVKEMLCKTSPHLLIPKGQQLAPEGSKLVK